MEPEWTKKISSTAVCNWYWIFFVVSAIASVLIVFAMVYILSTKAFSIREGGFKMFMLLIQLGIATTSALFYYITCDRALKPT
jgi:hypothetical protein